MEHYPVSTRAPGLDCGAKRERTIRLEMVLAEFISDIGLLEPATKPL